MLRRVYRLARRPRRPRRPLPPHQHVCLLSTRSSRTPPPPPRARAPAPPSTSALATFEQLPRHVPAQVKDNLRALELESATSIQSMALPALLNRVSVAKTRGRGVRNHELFIVGAETGSGKSICYQLPLLQSLLPPKLGSKDIASWLRKLALRPSKRASCLVVTPSRELGHQIVHDLSCLIAGDKGAETVSEDVVGLWLPRSVPRTSKRLDRAEIAAASVHPRHLAGRVPPVLVSTASYLRNLIQADRKRMHHVLSGTELLVVDEADQVVRPGKRYEPLRARIQREVHPPAGLEVVDFVMDATGHRLDGREDRPPKAPLTSILVTATASHRLKSVVGARRWHASPQVIRPTKLFEIPKSIEHLFVEAEPEDMVDAIRVAFDKLACKAALLVVDDHARVNDIAAALGAAGLRSVAAHKYLADTAERRHEFLAAVESGDVQVPVVTESVARGLHFEALDHVILAGLPSTKQGYMHVAGRTGRMNRPGAVVTVLPASVVPRLRRLGRHFRFEPRLLCAVDDEGQDESEDDKDKDEDLS